VRCGFVQRWLLKLKLKKNVVRLCGFLSGTGGLPFSSKNESYRLIRWMGFGQPRVKTSIPKFYPPELWRRTIERFDRRLTSGRDPSSLTMEVILCAEINSRMSHGPRGVVLGMGAWLLTRGNVETSQQG
jgi:hypothetical protein